MTDAELQAIRERAEKILPGPWRIKHTDDTSYLPYGDCFPRELWISVTGDRSKETAEFLGHARTDIPALLAEIERLKAELAVSVWIKYTGEIPPMPYVEDE